MKQKPPPPATIPSSNDSWLTADDWVDGVDIKAHFNISTSTLNRWRKGGLRYSKTGAKIFYLKSNVHAFLNSNQVKKRET